MRLPWPDGPFVVPEGTPGAITIIGRLYDGAGNIIPDGLIETWQAGPDGRFAHPDDPRGATPGGYQSFRGFGRCPTAPDGSGTKVKFTLTELPNRERASSATAWNTPSGACGDCGLRSNTWPIFAGAFVTLLTSIRAGSKK